MVKKIVKEKKEKKSPGLLDRLMAPRTPAKKEQKVDFKFQAPDAKKVQVAGSFNAWKPGALALKRDRSGLWTGTVSLPSGVYEYRFVVNGIFVDDPLARKTVTNNFGSVNAVLEVK